MKVLELFCGIGGCAAAITPADQVVAAVDQNHNAIVAYRANYRHRAFACAVADLPESAWYHGGDALWWMSPPCQPFTSRGNRRDLDDPRCDGFKFVIERIKRHAPQRIVLENVPGFAGSRAHRLLSDTLALHQYHVSEWILCPTRLGVPMRRKRFYVAADRDDLRVPVTLPNRVVNWETVIDPKFDRVDCPDLIVPSEECERHREAIHIVDRASQGDDAVARCFTSGYSKSPRYSGSCLRMLDGRVRRFAPHEILRLLGFPETFVLPSELSLQQQWALVGNSLSVDAVQFVLNQFKPSGQSPDV